MAVRDIIEMAFAALRERKLRAAVTVLMVVVGSALLTGLNGMSAGLNDFVTGQFNTLGANVIIVVPGDSTSGSSARITDQTKMLIQNTPGVVLSQPFIQQMVTVRVGGESVAATLLGIDRGSLPEIFPTMKIQDGRLGSQNDPTILLGNLIANPPSEPAGFARVGQTVTVEFVTVEGEKQVVQRRSLLVDGVLENMGSTGMFIPVDRMVFISTQTANSLFEKGGRYDGLYVVAEDETAVASVTAALRDFFGGGAEIFSSQSIVKMVGSVMGTIQLFLGSIASISLVVAAVGIFAALYTSVIERTREIGVLKAIGFPNFTIISLFVFEATLVGLIGGALGDFAGVGVAYLLTGWSAGEDFGGEIGTITMQPVFSVEGLLTVWFFSVFLSIIAGVYPAWRASKLDPVIALRKD